MAKAKKKRNKQYRGEDAAVSTNVNIQRFEAVERSRLSQWWFEKKRMVRLVAIVGGVLVVVGWLIVEAVRIVF